MKAVYTDMHTRHAPAEITLRGLIAANLEVPGRAEHLLHALQAGGHEIVAPRDFGMEPILAIHDRDYIEFLRTAYRGRLREGAESYAKALANDILR